MRCYKTKPIFNADIPHPKVNVIKLSKEESMRAYYSLCEGVQEAARKAREEAPYSQEINYLRITQ